MLAQVSRRPRKPLVAMSAHRASGYKVETLPRSLVVGSSAGITSGLLYLQLLAEPLLAGVSYSSMSFLSGGSAASGPTHQWFTLVRASDLTVLRSTVDDTTTAWAGSITKTLALSSAYVPPVDTVAYAGFLMTATTSPINVRPGLVTSATTVSAIPPILCGTSSSGLTTPLADGVSVSALTATVNLLWAGVS